MRNIRYPNYLFCLLCATVLLLSCGGAEKEAVPSFYHWKANMNIGENEINYMDSLGLRKLYVRFFDVHWDAQKETAYPLSPVQWKAFDMGYRLEIVPVVYITNITLKNNEYDRGVDSLAKNIATKLDTILSKLDTTRFWVRELQLDCDWSETTGAKYFRLIEQLKKYLKNIQIFSATIRLHQVKYFTSTGVPPVDKGVLMFYNMGDVAHAYEKNSILNLETAKKYMKNFEVYPLPLDIALPLFAWGVQFRQKRIIQLINDVSLADLDKNTNFTKIDTDRFKAIKSDYLQGIYIYKNDEIRIESVTAVDLKQALKMLRKAFGSNKNFEVVFYHLDASVIQQFKPHEILEIIN